MGERLRDSMGENVPKQESRKNKTILVWKYGKAIEKRHLYNYGKRPVNPFRSEICKATACSLTYDEGQLDKADAVLFHLHRTKGLDDLPSKRGSNPNQKWIFLTDESVKNIFYSSPSSEMKGIFLPFLL